MKKRSNDNINSSSIGNMKIRMRNIINKALNCLVRKSITNLDVAVDQNLRISKPRLNFWIILKHKFEKNISVESYKWFEKSFKYSDKSKMLISKIIIYKITKT